MANRRSPSGPELSWQEPVDTTADLPLTGNNPGDARVSLDTSEIWIWNGTLWTTGGAAEDHKVAVTAADAVPSFLQAKLAAGTPKDQPLPVKPPSSWGAP